MNIKVLKNIMRGSFFVFVFKLFGAFSAFFISLIISKYSGPAALGKFQLLSKFVLIISVFATAGLDIYVIRKIPEIGDNRERTVKFIKNSFKVFFLLSLFFFITLAPFAGSLEKYFFKTGEVKPYIYCSLVFVFFYVCFSFICQLFRGYGNVIAYSFFRYSWLNVFLLIFLGCSIFIFGSLEDHLIYNSYFASIIISFIGIVIFTIDYFSRKNFSNQEKIQDPPFTNELKKSTPMMLSSSFGLLYSYSSIFILGYYQNEYFVGIYTAMSQFMLLFTYISISIASYSAPIIAKKYIAKDVSGLQAIYFNSVIAGSLALVPIFIILAFFPYFVLSITFGEEYVKYDNVMTILSIGYFINALTGPTITTMNMTDQQKKLLYVSIFNLAIFLILCFYFTREFGIIGTAAAASFSTGLFNIILFVIIIRNVIRFKRVNEN